jgi:hypothetical protein
LLNTKYWSSMNLEVCNFDPVRPTILIHCFGLFWLVPPNHNETVCLISQLLPLGQVGCFCAL